MVIVGYQKNAVLSDQKKKVVAYHEIGHDLVAALQSHSAPVQKITCRLPQTAASSVSPVLDRKSTRLNSSHSGESRMPSSA